MRVGLKIGLDQVLPVALFARLAIDYANLKLAGHENLGPLWADFRQKYRKAGDPSQWTVATALLAPDFQAAEDQATHSWVRGLLAGMVEGTPPAAHDLVQLDDLISRFQPQFHLAFDRPNVKKGKTVPRTGAVDVALVLPLADLLWFISIGISALIDTSGALHGAVRKCLNFNGSGDHRSEACHSYLLRYSFGGRAPSQYCSDVCRNRVNVRRAAPKKLKEEKESLGIARRARAK